MKTLMMTAMIVGLVINVAHAGPLPEAKPDDVGFSQQGLTRLDDFVAREIAAKRVPGAVVAIARDGKLVHYKAYGQLDATRIAAALVSALGSQSVRARVCHRFPATLVSSPGMAPTARSSSATRRSVLSWS
jgi:hypothetical protein